MDSESIVDIYSSEPGSKPVGDGVESAPLCLLASYSCNFFCTSKVLKLIGANSHLADVWGSGTFIASRVDPASGALALVNFVSFNIKAMFVMMQG